MLTKHCLFRMMKIHLAQNIQVTKEQAHFLSERTKTEQERQKIKKGERRRKNERENRRERERERIKSIHFLQKEQYCL